MVLRLLHAFLVVTFFAVMVESSGATTVTIHTEDARATLKAMQDHSLTKDEATKIATMHGNQAVIRKLQEFKIPATVQTFADALYSAAHDQAARGLAEQAIGLDHVKLNIPLIVALLDEIQAHPRVFEQPIQRALQCSRLPTQIFILTAMSLPLAMEAVTHLATLIFSSTSASSTTLSWQRARQSMKCITRFRDFMHQIVSRRAALLADRHKHPVRTLNTSSGIYMRKDPLGMSKNSRLCPSPTRRQPSKCFQISKTAYFA
ncbi:hypothetical protein [Tunturibacter empetritectus]|uniref:Uncharacterized protein n=1 Tax=Tunturiibacter lichenicola TaxID=2051959 RepID=A0A7W8JBK3_9BACT|nr:hypothetical protein [Edaphobacter lichenicola]MBB5346254.1 hypothetical protein [Edaphobacter lichenicola]